MSAFQKQRAIIVSALNPHRLPVMAGKIRRRFFSRRGGIGAADYGAWLQENAVPVDRWCEAIDRELWQESQNFVEGLFGRYEALKQNLPQGLGGNACVRLLYFVTRRCRPETILETGVALGFSSQTFLKAMQINGGGRLYSSDFPYFRLPDAEKYIGIMVEDDLKKNWTLRIDGDDRNIPALLKEIGTIDLFHYDSDKTYEGRQRAFEMVRDKITPGTVIVVDDIRDNPHFYDLVRARGVSDWQVLEYRGGFIGVINAGRISLTDNPHIGSNGV